MIADVYSVADVGADELRWAESPWQRWPCVRLQDLGPMELARLGEVLGVDTYDEVLAGFVFLAGESQESPWVVAVPDGLVQALVSAASDELRAMAEGWSTVIERDERASLRSRLERLSEFLTRHESPFGLYIDRRR